MSSGRGSGGAAGAAVAAIPSSARKLVQTIKEIVAGNSDDDIYSMLKECNMDLDQTVQRLLNQDPFHEVKRKRDKKKEGATRENTDARMRSSSIGISSRGGRSSGSFDRNAGRGNSLPQYGPNEFTGGRGKAFIVKENGNHSSTRTTAISVDSTLAAGALKSSPPVVASSVLETSSSSFVQNGGPPHARSVSGHQLTWVAVGSGNSTVAEILKTNGPQPPLLPASAPVHTAPLPVSTTSILQSPVSSNVTSVSSGVYSSLSDPVLQRPLDLRISSSPGAIKKGVGTVGIQRSVGDRPLASFSLDGNSVSPSSVQTQVSSGTTAVAPTSVQDNELHTEHVSQSVSVSGSLPRSVAVSVPLAEISSSIGDQPLESGAHAVTDSSPSRSGIISNQFINRHLYQPQQPPVGTQKSSGAGLEWKPKPIGQGSLGLTTPIGTSSAIVSADSLRSPPSSDLVESNVLSSTTTLKFRGLSMQDDQPVIMPNRLQISEADHTHLSFGSFGAGFGASISTNFGSEESSKIHVKDNSVAAESIQESSSSVVTSDPVPSSQTYIQHQETSAQAENSSSTIEVGAVSSPGPIVSQSGVSKPGTIVQQGPPYPYLPTVPNYPGFGLIPQIPGGQFSFEPSESLTADVPRLSSLVQPYADPTTSYYTPFRPVSDAESRYPPFLSSKAIGKYNGNVAIVTGQSLPSQESGNSLVLSSTGLASSQASPTSSVQAVPTMPQQPLPIHAYAAHPASVPLGHFTNVFGYQYVPPSYPYLHTPYQHNYPGSGGYPQAATGTNYPSPGNNYPPGTGLTLKYPLTQYKPSSGTLNSHAAPAAGFGAYTSTPSGFAGNPTVTIGTASAYEEVAGPQYKESNLYIPSQQAEGSTIWVQTQLSRDVAAAGMQASSYYNLPGQGQHSPYAHALPTGSYGNMYQASQTAPAPSAHQLIQQQHALGTGGAGGAQGAAYQQARVQQNWSNNY
ncbi:hypothetical protein O6H91_01G135100 [Diphasiastrum complanatum]|uniref:Uncharacterized protein n=3 Tax=Diphasiastrum complanatum TaxID=34168 RepID=A0ACC2EWT9_DIPCM|nr:hypothetical protein O6H91_01G135100 [Diphasiastrum complanatum]KAJ7570786.1 hypothetical protein O6H91_01G135100 [Diphasiastrum complanatum]